VVVRREPKWLEILANKSAQSWYSVKVITARASGQTETTVPLISIQNFKVVFVIGIPDSNNSCSKYAGPPLGMSWSRRVQALVSNN